MDKRKILFGLAGPRQCPGKRKISMKALLFMYKRANLIFRLIYTLAIFTTLPNHGVEEALKKINTINNIFIL